MYKAHTGFDVPTEVKDFQNDCDALGMLCDLQNWYITEDWAKRFRTHLERILPVAEAGNPWAQYNIGVIYIFGYLHSSQEEFEKHQTANTIQGSKWLERAARQGFVAAVDNLVVVGAGEEAERLRKISKEVERDHPEYIQQWQANKDIPVITPAFFEKVWEIAYGNHS